MGHCLSSFWPDKAVQNGSRQFCDFLCYRFSLPNLGLAEKMMTNAVNELRQPPLFIYLSHFNLQVLTLESYRLFGYLACQQYQEGRR